MFGQWPVGGVADLGVLDGVLDLAGVEPDVAAAAPAMPIAEPVRASTHVRSAALISLEMCTRWSLQ